MPLRDSRVRAAVVAALLVAGAAAAEEPDGKGEDLLARGRAALERGATEEAVLRLRAAVAADVECIEGWSLLGRALERKGDAEGAVEAHRRAGSAATTRAEAGPVPRAAREAARTSAAR